MRDERYALVCERSACDICVVGKPLWKVGVYRNGTQKILYHVCHDCIPEAKRRIKSEMDKKGE